MSFLTTPFVKNGHILAGIYFIFLKKHHGPNLKSFDAKFGQQWKDWRNGYQVRHHLALFCKSVALILGWKGEKDVIVTKIALKVKFERA